MKVGDGSPFRTLEVEGVSRLEIRGEILFVQTKG